MFHLNLQIDETYKRDDFQELLRQKTPLDMSFLDGSHRSYGSFHLKRNITYTLKFSEALTGQFELIVIRKNYPYVPLLFTCPP